MIVFYLIGFLLLCGATVLLLGLTPERVTDDMMRFICPKRTLRDKVLIAKGKKRSRKLTVEILHIKDALDATGKGKQFAIACAASVLLLVIGCILAVIIDNLFLIPVLAVAFASLPFFYIKSTIAAYDRHVQEEMETALSIITTSYVRSDDILGAVQENISYLKPPIRGIFQTFVGEAMMISSDMKTSIRNLKEKISNTVFEEWCDTLIACQDDRTLKDTLLPIVNKLTDVRIVNNELKTMLSETRKEYWMMVCLVIGNIPLLYVLNKSWYEALMFTTLGKAVLAICGVVIFITALLMMKYTKPIEYKR